MKRRAAVLIVLVATAACGGGTDSSSDSTGGPTSVSVTTGDTSPETTIPTSSPDSSLTWTVTSDVPEWSNVGSRSGPVSPPVTEGDALTDGTYVMNEVVFDESGEVTALQVIPFTEATAPTADPVTVPFRTDSDTQVVIRTPGCRLGVITETAWRLDWPSFLTSMRDFASRVVEFSDAVRPVHDLEASGGFLDYVSIDVPSEFIRPSDCLRSFTWSPFVDAPFEESPWLLVWWAADETGSLDEVWRSSVYPAAIDIDSGVATLYFDARIQNIGE